MTSRKPALVIVAVALVLAAFAALRWLPRSGPASATPAPLAYVGGASCADCHAEEARRWRGSHHDLAMQRAEEGNVRGAFDGRTFRGEGVSARFFRRDGRYLVETDGPDGKPAEFAVAYVFGVTPLEQYLIETSAGRLQALGVAWDSRPREAGGQRFFHLYPGERIDHRDVLHWTQPSQNWNTQCAECHSTNLRKGYLPAQDRFQTTFSELDVSCEACHGPGSRHVEWAGAARSRGEAPAGDPGLVVRFDERRGRTWTTDPVKGILRPTTGPKERPEVETCARCHARRGLLTEDYTPGQLLAQTHRPSLLEEGLYYADGQMRDEVYNWGSFLQSRMHAAGVTCSDCHDPHDAKVRGGRDAVCASCHRNDVYATRRHHFHDEGGRGASCVACHMRSETYMVVDERHDHSFRVPRPDLTVALGAAESPNACNDCHRDRSPEWAARAVARAYPNGRQSQPHYATALYAARHYRLGAEQALLDLARNPALAGIVRGTAVSLLPPHMGPASLPVLAAAAGDADPVVRLGAAGALEALPAIERRRIGSKLLSDPVRAVRVEAAAALADMSPADLDDETSAALERALADYRQVQEANAERPEAHVNLGLLNLKRGDRAVARRDYERALALAPWFVPAWVNLADLLRLEGRDEEGEKALRSALAVDPRHAAVRHALGLLLVREKRMPEALAELRQAAALDPAAPDFAYAYALALHGSARTDEALAVLRAANARLPGARHLLVALVTLNRDRGAIDEARRWAQKLVAAAPSDPDAQALLRELGGETAARP